MVIVEGQVEHFRDGSRVGRNTPAFSPRRFLFHYLKMSTGAQSGPPSGVQPDRRQLELPAEEVIDAGHPTFAS
jgi:hypothetical protein